MLETSTVHSLTTFRQHVGINASEENRIQQIGSRLVQNDVLLFLLFEAVKARIYLHLSLVHVQTI